MYSSQALSRYLGHRVIVQTYGHQRVMGTLKSVDVDSIVLADSRLQNNDVEIGWFDRIAFDDENMADAYPETIVPIGAVLAVTTIDDVEDILPPPSEPEVLADAPKPLDDQEPEPLPDYDPILLELGAGLVRLADARHESADLLERVGGLRRQLFHELGFRIPKVRVRDNCLLGVNEYVLKICGVPVATATVLPDSLWAIGEEERLSQLEGNRTTDSLTGRTGVWICSDQREKAESIGLSVVEPTIFIIVAVANALRRCASRIFDLQELDSLLDAHGRIVPQSTTHLVPDTVSTHRLHAVLLALLSEGVSIQFLPDIVAAVARAQEVLIDPEAIVERVRRELGHLIVASHLDSRMKLRGLNVSSNVIDLMRELNGDDPEQVTVFRDAFVETVKANADDQSSSVVVTAPENRLEVSQHLRSLVPKVIVMSHGEIPADCRLQIVGTVSADGISDVMSRLIDDRLAGRETDSEEVSPPPRSSGMRIQTNVSSTKGLRKLKASGDLDSALRRLSTGLTLDETSPEPKEEPPDSDDNDGTFIITN